MITEEWEFANGASTRLPERPKGSILADRSHERWSVLNDHAPRIAHKLIGSAARGGSHGDVDRSSRQLRNLPFTTLRSRALSGRIRRICSSFQELLEIKRRPIRGRSFVRIRVGTAGSASACIGTR